EPERLALAFSPFLSDQSSRGRSGPAHLPSNGAGHPRHGSRRERTLRGRDRRGNRRLHARDRRTDRAERPRARLRDRSGAGARPGGRDSRSASVGHQRLSGRGGQPPERREGRRHRFGRSLHVAAAGPRRRDPRGLSRRPRSRRHDARAPVLAVRRGTAQAHVRLGAAAVLAPEPPAGLSLRVPGRLRWRDRAVM
ncbi:MAG: hypothetical protein AVDCRST_MAG17-1760, partial [uncultured Solirubrobacterales bacterium]